MKRWSDAVQHQAKLPLRCTQTYFLLLSFVLTTLISSSIPTLPISSIHPLLLPISRTLSLPPPPGPLSARPSERLLRESLSVHLSVKIGGGAAEDEGDEGEGAVELCG